jgi:hypothetical protein
MFQPACVTTVHGPNGVEGKVVTELFG